MASVRLAWRQLRHQLGQLSVAIVVIALGVALAAGMLLANAALRESFEESVDALAGAADLQIRARSGGAFDEGVLGEVKGVPGVAAAAPLLLGRGFLEDESRTAVRLVGVDMLDEATVRVYERSPTESAGIEDPLIFLNQTDSVLVSEGFLRRHGFERDEGFALQTPAGRKMVVPRGILAEEGVARAFGGEMAIVDLYAAQEIVGSPGGVSQIDVAVEPDVSVDEVGVRLREVLPSHLGIETVEARRAEMSDLAAGFSLMVNAMSGIGLLLAILITANRLSTIYLQRQWELSVLRGQGMSAGSLLRNLLMEAGVVSSIAVALGLPLGVVFAQIIVQPVADTMSLNLGQTMLVPWVEPRLSGLALAAVAGIGSGVLAAWLPARRAVNESVSAVMRKGSRRAPTEPSVRRTQVRVGVSAAAALALGVELAAGPTAVAPVVMGLFCVAAGLLVQPCLRLVVRPMTALLGKAAYMGVKDQSMTPSRAFGAAGVLMAGVAAVVWIAGMAVSFEAHVVGNDMTARRADLIVDSNQFEKSSSLTSDAPRLTVDLLRAIAKLPGVSSAAAEADGTRYATGNTPGISAIDSDRFADPRSGVWLVGNDALPGALELVGSGDAVLVDRVFARNRGVEVGQLVQLESPSGSFERVVAGIAPSSFYSTLGDVILSRELYRRYWRDDGISRIFVMLDEGVSSGSVRQAIQEQFAGDYGVRVASEQELRRTYAEAVRDGFAFLDVLSVLTLLVVLVGTADALSSNVLERTREIGLLRSLGLAPGHVASMVIGQATAIGLVGAGLAIVLGLGLGYEFVGGILPGLLGWQLDFQFTLGVALIAATLGILACLVGASIPALRASRISIVEALRQD